MQFFLKCEFFVVFCIKCAKKFMKNFSSCKNFNDVLIMYAKFLRNVLLDATFSIIFQKIAKTKLNFFMQLQKSKFLF